MFAFRNRKPKNDRDHVIADFESAVAAFHKSEPDVKRVVAYGINFAHSAFRQRFPTTKDFEKLPQTEKHQYLESLTKLEDGCGGKDPLFGLGVGLFKAWVGAIAFNDVALERLTGIALADMGRSAPTN